MSAPLKVFITGATGYIGGEFLYKLLHESSHNVSVRALVRTKGKSELLLRKTVFVEPVIGDLDDSELLAEEFAKADLIINAGINNHLSSIKVLENVLKHKKTLTYVFYISGVGIFSTITDDSFWSDIKDNNRILAAGDEKPHIEVDRTIWNLESINPLVKTVIISPPTVFGTSHGYDNIFSSQIPDLIKYSLQLGQVFTVEDGEFRWSNVNINNLGDLFLFLLDKLVEDPKSIKTGKEGYYFVETGDNSWKDVSIEIAKRLYERGAIKTEEIKQLTRQEVNQLTGIEYDSLWGTFALTKADLAKSYGWSPTNTNLFWKNIGISVEYTLKGRK